jgi:hypothetical protein
VFSSAFVKFRDDVGFGGIQFVFAGESYIDLHKFVFLTLFFPGSSQIYAGAIDVLKVYASGGRVLRQHHRISDVCVKERGDGWF